MTPYIGKVQKVVFIRKVREMGIKENNVINENS